MTGILNVCTANRCRSAIAERLMREALPDDVPVSSAGTRARRGEPIWPSAGTELLRRKVSPFGFESFPITPQLMSGADLVVTATRAHRDELLSEHPYALGRVFTLRELAWLLSGVERGQVPGRSVLERVKGVQGLAAARRSSLVPPLPRDLDIDDPVDHGDAAVALATEQIAAAVRTIVHPLV